jgi:gliding motility-associated-like protein/uncharacterized repeat protein (TIGR01451 family)
MTKESLRTFYSTVGDVIPYTIRLTNTGNETILGIALSDAQATTGPTLVSGDTDSDSELDVSETWTYTATYSVVQADIDAGSFTNTATASATFPVGLANSTASKTLSAILNPSWVLISSVTPTYQSVGQQLIYSMSLTNTGNEPISSITVSDPQATTGPTLVSGDTGNDLILGTGEVWVYSSSRLVTQADIDAGAITATFTASGTPGAGTLPNATSSVPSTAVQLPSWTTTLSSTTPTFSQPGDPINYTLTISNTGNVSINSVIAAITKASSGPSFQSGDDGDNMLEPGETWQYQAGYLITQADLDAGSVLNTSSFTGTPAGGSLGAASANQTTLATPIPSWTIGKVSNTPSFRAIGDVVSFTITVANTGNVSISGVMLNDPQADSGPTLTSGDVGNDNVMGVGETWVYAATSTIVQADLDAGELVNTITASGTPAQGTLADVSDVSLVPASIFPDWVMVKVATVITYDSPGETLNYLILLTNTGNETISSVTVNDAKATTGPTYSSGDVDADNVLDPGETWTYNASYQTTQADVDNGVVSNTADATGTPAQGSLHSVSASATVSATLNPAWTMTHVVTPLTYSAPGNTILYQVTLANTGNVSLTNVLLTESKVTSAITLQSGDLDSDLVLDVGESWVYSASYDATQADLDAGSFEALASATATPAGGILAPATSSQMATAIQTPAWTIQKVTLTPSYTVPDNTVTYQVRLRNTGNVTINTVSLTESNTTTPNVLTSGDANADNKLDVNEEWVFESTYLVTLADVTAGSVASVTTATGVPAGGILPELSATAEATAVQAPAWSIAKTSDKQQYDDLDEVITYTIEVSNTGNIPISITSVADDKVTTPPAYTAGDGNADGLLSLGEKWIYTATYVVAQHDLIVGSIASTATAVGTPEAGTVSPVSASTIILAGWKTSSSGIVLDPAEGFSPNGDGINDFWWIKDIEAFPNNTVWVYNSIGSLIFKTSGYDNTNNRFDGLANQNVAGSSTLNAGTYYYVIEIAGQNRLSGYFTLLK